MTTSSLEQLVREKALEDFNRKAAASTPGFLKEAESLADKYPQYYKRVGNLKQLDVYAVHKLFEINDPTGCIQHASKKLLLSGVRTGGKSMYADIKEARDTLTRWLELNSLA